MADLGVKGKRLSVTVEVTRNDGNFDQYVEHESVKKYFGYGYIWP